MNLGENICRLRTARGMSQGDLAEALDVSRQSISKWETGGAVPELEKLMKLSALFGVTLDELVTGERPPAAAPEPPSPATPERRGLKARHVAGIVLMCLGLLLLLVLTLLGAWPLGLWLASPLWVCGVICLAARRHPGLWCLWAVFLLTDGFLRHATGVSWAAVWLTPRWTPEMNYISLGIAWCQLLGGLTLLTVTVWRLGREPLERTERNRRLFWGGWALFALLCLPFSQWISRAGAGMLSLYTCLQLAGWLQDILRLGLLAGLLTCLRRWTRVPRAE